jgi:hypothetical protein
MYATLLGVYVDHRQECQYKNLKKEYTVRIHWAHSLQSLVL